MSDLKLEALAATSLFASCTKQQLELIGRVTDRSRPKTGTILIRENEVPTHMFMLISGKATVERAEVQLAELGAGDVIGELSLVDDARASATVTISEDAEAWVIAHNGFKPVWEENPEMSYSLLQAVVGRLRAANDLAT